MGVGVTMLRNQMILEFMFWHKVWNIFPENQAAHWKQKIVRKIFSGIQERDHCCSVSIFQSGFESDLIWYCLNLEENICEKLSITLTNGSTSSYQIPHYWTIVRWDHLKRIIFAFYFPMFPFLQFFNLYFNAKKWIFVLKNRSSFIRFSTDLINRATWPTSSCGESARKKAWFFNINKLLNTFPFDSHLTLQFTMQ